MRSTLLRAALLVAAASPVAGAQVRARVATPSVWRVDTDDSPRAVIGIGTASSATARDTLGLLVTSITPKSPAERAGLEEGNRIQSVNGANLRLASGDVDDWEMQGIMQRRLTRELSKVKPGDEVELRVWASGQARTLRVRTVDSDSLYPSTTRRIRNVDDERPTLGLGIGSTGTARDTLGVFVMTVNDSGPAARAGIEEGNRIAAINNVDLRVSRADAGDEMVGSAKARRLEREIADVRPGDDVELRVWQNGQYRTIHVKAVRRSELPRQRRTTMIFGPDGGFGFGMGGDMAPVIAPMPPRPPRGDGEPFVMRLDGSAIGGAVRANVERALVRANEAMERAMERAHDDMRWDMRWDDDVDHDRDMDHDSDDETPRPARAPRATGGSGTGGVRAAPRARAATPLRSAQRADEAAPMMTYAVGTPSTAPAALQASDVLATPDDAMDVNVDGATIDVAGLRLAPVTAELARYLGEGSRDGLLVVSAPAWAEGVRAGDVLLAVNGRAVRDGDAANVSLDRRREITFTLLRDGARRTVTVR